MRTAFRVNRRNGGNHSVNDTHPPGPSQAAPCNWRKPGPFQLAQTPQTGPFQLAHDSCTSRHRTEYARPAGEYLPWSSQLDATVHCPAAPTAQEFKSPCRPPEDPSSAGVFSRLGAQTSTGLLPETFRRVECYPECYPRCEVHFEGNGSPRVPHRVATSFASGTRCSGTAARS